MTFRLAGATCAASRSKPEGVEGGTCSANDKMSLSGLGPEGSSEVGMGVVTILGFPLLRLYNPDVRFALRPGKRVVPGSSVADQGPLLPHAGGSGAGYPLTIIEWC
jgi:hypothetical protein